MRGGLHPDELPESQVLTWSGFSLANRPALTAILSRFHMVVLVLRREGSAPQIRKPPHFVAQSPVKRTGDARRNNSLAQFPMPCVNWIAELTPDTFRHPGCYADNVFPGYRWAAHPGFRFCALSYKTFLPSRSASRSLCPKIKSNLRFLLSTMNAS